MSGTRFVLLHLIIGMITAQQPSVNVVTKSASFVCTDEYLLVGEDFLTFVLDLSGNNSAYTFSIFDGPRFKRQKLETKNGKTKVIDDGIICQPFLRPHSGSCVTKAITNTTGCSCEVIRPSPPIYRVKLVYRIEDVSDARGRLELLWPSTNVDISEFYYLPDVRAEPKIKEVSVTPSFICTLDFQVEGVDYTILDLDMSGNSSRYSFKKDVWPRLEYKTRRNGKFSKAILFCTPFTIPQNGFCVTKQSFPNACSCEHVGKDTFRLRANFSLRSVEMSHGQIFLIWPGKYGPVRYNYDLPEVRKKPGMFQICDYDVLHFS
ncbi:hypothetical protein PoB_000600100 [Plakobranchus ocellatus]|uniref:Uncharacterized protein n=1 Tax=Plakobranchus ocellatus TaxID=259542 RepID=A0AAV3YAR7_9GAST|nr:hypothetical protein PoB_000600100 [Plakobranchus ocellatus]